MRRKSNTAAVALAAVLLAGCSGGAGEEAAPGTSENGKATAGSQEQAGGAADGSEGEEKSGREAEMRKVTLEVGGEGETRISWTIGTNKSETVTLPWTKTENLTLEDAQLKVGAVVSVIPGSVKEESGVYKPAPCVIEVDGKKVADNDEGESADGCRHTVK